MKTREKVRKAALSLLPQSRRTTAAVEFDRLYLKKLKSELPEYLSMYFIINKKDIINAGNKYKDFIIKILNKRIDGIHCYGTLYIP